MPRASGGGSRVSARSRNMCMFQEFFSFSARPMSEEEEEIQDQKQTIDAKCKARTQRALP